MQANHNQLVHLIKPSGKSSPEYVVLHQSLGEISGKIKAEETEFSHDLHSAGVIPSSKVTSDLMDTVLNEVAANALKFYAFLQVLDHRNVNYRYSAVLEQLDGRFLGKLVKVYSKSFLLVGSLHTPRWTLLRPQLKVGMGYLLSCVSEMWLLNT